MRKLQRHGCHRLQIAKCLTRGLSVIKAGGLESAKQFWFVMEELVMSSGKEMEGMHTDAPACVGPLHKEVMS